MIIDISERSISSIIEEANFAISEIVYEFEYNTLLYKYNFLKENGSILEISLSDIKKWAGKAISFMGESLKNLWASIKRKFNNIKDRINNWKDRRRADRLVEEFEQMEEMFNNAAENIKGFGQFVYDKAVNEQQVRDAVHKAEEETKRTTAKAKKVAIILDDSQYTVKD